jgi:hypothetical protein
VPAFARYIGIDYSGAETPTSGLKGLRIYLAEGDERPIEVQPPPSPRKYWTRKGIAEWLVERLAENKPTLVGIDHGFSFPLRYFDTHSLLPDWSGFLDDFERHWPTSEDEVWVRDVLNGAVGASAARMGDRTWLRETERRTKSAKSVFNFAQKQGCVAYSTHAGIPWLRFIRQRLGDCVHFWPFDGWDIPAGRSAIAEVYPALWSRDFPRDDRTNDQHDAFSIAAWLSRADRDGTLGGFPRPELSPLERTLAQVEGWILGARATDEVEGKLKPERKPEISEMAKRRTSTTMPGYINKNGQKVLRKTDEPGSDHNQRVYVLSCSKCGHEYGANGSDIWQRRCPACQGGAIGPVY